MGDELEVGGEGGAVIRAVDDGHGQGFVVLEAAELAEVAIISFPWWDLAGRGQLFRRDQFLFRRQGEESRKQHHSRSVRRHVGRSVVLRSPPS